MAAKKTKVVYVKRVEDRDKDGNKVVTPAGTKAELTAAELKKVQHAVREIKEEKDVSARPVLGSTAPPAGGDDEDEEEDDDTGTNGQTGGASTGGA